MHRNLPVNVNQTEVNTVILYQLNQINFKLDMILNLHKKESPL